MCWGKNWTNHFVVCLLLFVEVLYPSFPSSSFPSFLFDYSPSYVPRLPLAITKEEEGCKEKEHQEKDQERQKERKALRK